MGNPFPHVASSGGKASVRRTKRAKAQPGLVLARHGVSLRVENGALTIQNGFTHYPQQREMVRLAATSIVVQTAVVEDWSMSGMPIYYVIAMLRAK
jgi:hypothetical protein